LRIYYFDILLCDTLCDIVIVIVIVIVKLHIISLAATAAVAKVVRAPLVRYFNLLSAIASYSTIEIIDDTSTSTLVLSGARATARRYIYIYFTRFIG